MSDPGLAPPPTKSREPAVRVLVADLQADARLAVRRTLQQAGILSDEARTRDEVLERLATRSFDVVLLDERFLVGSVRPGLIDDPDPDMLLAVRELAPHAAVLLHEAPDARGEPDAPDSASVERSAGASRLVAAVRTQSELARRARVADRLRRENEMLGGEPQPRQAAAASPAMLSAMAMIRKTAVADVPVLLTGEHGTGKELLVRTLHDASRRRDQRLVFLKPAGLPQETIEAELFGVQHGTTERPGRIDLADGATLCIQEIAALPEPTQSRLLRFIETGEFQRCNGVETRKADVRLIATCSCELQHEADAGRFREDLLFRLSAMEVKVPPLRDRREDQLALAEHFLAEFAAKYERLGVRFSAGAVDAIRSHNWPGNVRELRHAVERGVLMTEGSELSADDLGLCRKSPAEALFGGDVVTLEEAERRLIERALQLSGGKVAKAAKQLGLSRSGLYRRLEKYSMDPQTTRDNA